jgi:hypothetical protein
MSVVGQLVSTWKKHEERYLPLDPEQLPVTIRGRVLCKVVWRLVGSSANWCAALVCLTHVNQHAA